MTVDARDTKLIYSAARSIMTERRASQIQPFLSEILEDRPIPVEKLSYFRERFRDHLYEFVVEEFMRREQEGLTRAQLARRINKRPEQITRWLGSPGNWTLETASDLILAICKAEPDMRLKPLDGYPKSKHRGPTMPNETLSEQLALHERNVEDYKLARQVDAEARAVADTRREALDQAYSHLSAVVEHCFKNGLTTEIDYHHSYLLREARRLIALARK